MLFKNSAHRLFAGQKAPNFQATDVMQTSYGYSYGDTEAFMDIYQPVFFRELWASIRC